MKSIFSAILLCAAAVTPTSSVRSQTAREATIQPETKAKIVLQTRLSSKLSEVGDPVTAVLDEPIYVDNLLVLPRGTEFHGRVTSVKAAGKGQKQGSLGLIFERVGMPWGDEPVFVTVSAVDDWDKDKKLKANDEGAVKGGHDGGRTTDNVFKGGGIGGAGAGVLVLSGASGAAGAAALGGGLLSGLFLTKGGEVQLAPGAIFRVKFVKPLTLPVQGAPGPGAQRQTSDDDQNEVKTSKPVPPFNRPPEIR
jgi:hypothetical protein